MDGFNLSDQPSLPEGAAAELHRQQNPALFAPLTTVCTALNSGTASCCQAGTASSSLTESPSSSLPAVPGEEGRGGSRRDALEHQA